MHDADDNTLAAKVNIQLLMKEINCWGVFQDAMGFFMRRRLRRWKFGVNSSEAFQKIGKLLTAQ